MDKQVNWNHGITEDCSEEEWKPPCEPIPEWLLSLPAWRWPRKLLLAGHWMRVRCQTCGGAGNLDEPLWMQDCPDCTYRLRFRRWSCGGLTSWIRYDHVDLASFDWSTLAPNQAQVLQTYAEQLEDHLQEGWGLILTGAVGSGKTHVALAIGLVALGMGYTAYATTLGELLLSIRSSYQRDVESSESELLTTVCGVDLLVLDDLGIEKPTEWAKERLAYVINRRWSERLATIVTTNLSLDELEQRWDGRVMSRLYGSCQAVGFTNISDYRRVQRKAYLEARQTISNVNLKLLPAKEKV